MQKSVVFSSLWQKSFTILMGNFLQVIQLCMFLISSSKLHTWQVVSIDNKLYIDRPPWTPFVFLRISLFRSMNLAKNATLFPDWLVTFLCLSQSDFTRGKIYIIERLQFGGTLRWVKIQFISLAAALSFPHSSPKCMSERSGGGREEKAPLESQMDRE